MKFCCESEVRATRVIKITVETLSVSAKGQRRNIAEIDIKGHFCPSYNVNDDVKILAKVEYSTKMMIGVSADSRGFVKHVDSIATVGAYYKTRIQNRRSLAEISLANKRPASYSSSPW